MVTIIKTKPDNIKSEIYVKLLDEGVDVWRPVKADHAHNDVWQISEQAIPGGESWEFKPGNRVIVQGKEFQDGRHGLVIVSLESEARSKTRRADWVVHLLSVIALGFILITSYQFLTTGCVTTRRGWYEVCGDQLRSELVLFLTACSLLPVYSGYLLIKNLGKKK